LQADPLQGIAVVEPPPSFPANALTALIAGVLAFALAGAAIILLAGRPFEGWIFLASFAAAPAAVFALLPSRARLFCFGLGLLATLGAWFMDPSGPDNPLIVLPWIAWCFAGAAVVAELCVRAIRRLVRRPATET
jgi:hypothetical protein